MPEPIQSDKQNVPDGLSAAEPVIPPPVTGSQADDENSVSFLQKAIFIGFVLLLFVGLIIYPRKAQNILVK